MNSQICLIFAFLLTMSSTCLAQGLGVKGVHTKVDTFAAPPQRLRNLKKSSGNGSVERDGLLEIKPCVSMEKITDSQKEDYFGNGDAMCNTNQCDGGCCRAYNWLLCDTANLYPYVPCICNDMTQDPEEYTASTLPPQTYP